MKVLVSPSSFGQCGNEPIDLLKRNGFEIINNPFGRKLSEDEVIELGKESIGIIAGVESLSKKVMDNLPKLKCISRVGVGMDSIDLDYAKVKGITVVNTPDGPTRPVAELTLALTLALLRRVHVADANVKKNVWKKEIGYLLFGKTVGIIGLGRIGKLASKLFRSMGTEIIANDLSPDIEFAQENNIKIIDIESLLRMADIVTLHVPGNKIKTPLLKEKEFRLMKRNSFLINVSRGGVVDEDALYLALKEKWIEGAASDVFNKEPYSGKLTELDNILLTPHLGSYAEEAKLKMEIDAVQNLISALIIN